MNKCKNCETEEQGYGTLLDKRGYCYNPYCQSCSYDEVEQQNTRLQAQLDKEIHINRYLLERLWVISKHLHKESGISNETLIKYIEKLLEEFDYNPSSANETKIINRVYTIESEE